MTSFFGAIPDKFNMLQQWHIGVALRETEIDTFVRKGLLKADARNDLRAVREAVSAHLDNTLGSMT